MVSKLKLMLPLFFLLLCFRAEAQTFQTGKDAAQRGDFEEAFSIWLPLSRRGDVASQTNLAFLYKNGQGVERDLGKAVIWFTKAAENGDATAQNMLGLLYYSGQGVKQNFTKAAEYYQMAAEQGDRDSQYMLASLLRRGACVEQDMQAAARWFTFFRGY